LGRTVTPYTLPPDSPNLRMLAATVNERQRDAYLAPYVAGKTVSAIGISEPQAGGDPAGMLTRAVRVPGEDGGDDWVINGRKIWISRADHADFTILMAVTDREKGARGGMSAFLIDKGTPGFNVLRRIPMVGGAVTYEIALEDCRVEGWKLLGTEGQGFAPMQLRLGTRRLEMAAWSIGMAQRALDMMIDYAPQRKTFGLPLSERQAIQWWVADAATRIHAARLMTYDCAWKIDEGPRLAAGDLDDQGLRDRNGLGGRRPRDADFRRHGHDQGDAAAADGRQAAHHAHLRRPDRDPQMGGGPQPAGRQEMMGD
jgi:acyl-CoA dehydrogenase